MLYDENDELLDIDIYGGNWKISIDSEIIDIFEYKSDAIEGLIEELIIINNGNQIDYINLFDLYDIEMLDYNSFYEFIDNILDEININSDIKLICMNNDEPEFGEL